MHGNENEKRLNEKMDTNESQDPKDMNTTTAINTVFGEKCTRTILADGGVNGNLIPHDLLTKPEQKYAVMTVKNLPKPRRFGHATAFSINGDDIYIEWDKDMKINIELLIRHGCLLVLGNTTWFVPTCTVSEQLLGRPTLEDLGLNTKLLREAARGKSETTVDMNTLSTSNFEQGTIARVINEGMFHDEKSHT